MDQNVQVINSLEGARSLAGLPPPVHVEVTGCDPVRDASSLLEFITGKVTKGEWIVTETAISQLSKLKEGCDERLLARQELVQLVKRANEDLCGEGDTTDIHELQDHHRTVMLRELGLPADARAPRQFSEELFQALDAARNRLRERMLESRNDLVSLREYIQNTWLPWADERLNARLALGEPVLLE